MQAGTHSAVLSKSGNGRHVYVRVATPTHVPRGRKTYMASLYKHMRKLQSAIT